MPQTGIKDLETTLHEDTDLPIVGRVPMEQDTETTLDMDARSVVAGSAPLGIKGLGPTLRIDAGLLSVGRVPMESGH